MTNERCSDVRSLQEMYLVGSNDFLCQAKYKLLHGNTQEIDDNANDLVNETDYLLL